MASEEEGPSAKEADLRERFGDLLLKAIRLKEFAIKNGYEVDPKTIKALNELWWAHTLGGTPAKGSNFAVDSTKLDGAIAELTAVTFPTTIDLPVLKPGEEESPEYKGFKRRLWQIGLWALLFAIIGFGLSAGSAGSSGLAVGNSILAIGLGLLGAVTYSLFNVLRVVPPQAFDPKDEYYNYVRLLLGVLLGWVFYFAFAMEAFRELPTYLGKQAAAAVGSQTVTAPKYKLLVPFLAGYSTKFVVGVLERLLAALEVSLGIEEKRDVRTKRILSRRSSS